MDGYEEKRLCLAYPRHRFKPEDLLHFVESTTFTNTWDQAGLDVEEDLTSLQLCIMAHPEGDQEIKGTGGLRLHRHVFGDWSKMKDQAVTVYYAYFEDFGVVYLSCLDSTGSLIRFDSVQKASIKKSIASTLREIERVQSFH